MDINFEYYKIFYFVGKYGSFTQAARILHNNQPNITRIINNLESELGCRLFFRSKKGVAFTPEGKERLKQIAAENHTTVSGLITRWVWEYELKSEKAEQQVKE